MSSWIARHKQKNRNPPHNLFQENNQIVSTDDIKRDLLKTQIISASDNNQIKRYISGGKLGDFIYQLYVIYYNYKKFGKKGILYLSNTGDKFTFSLQKTYDDTKDIILSQEYIQDYQIYDNQKYDINLSSWRGFIKEENNMNWVQVYNAAFDVKWGIFKWIDCGIEPSYQNCILLNHSSMRYNTNIDIKNMVNLLLQTNIPIFFICFHISEYEKFNQLYNVSLSVIVCNTLYELCTKINSCRLFIGNLSSPLACSLALHKLSIGILPTDPKHYQTDVKLNSNLSSSMPFYNIAINNYELINAIYKCLPVPINDLSIQNEIIVNTLEVSQESDKLQEMQLHKEDIQENNIIYEIEDITMVEEIIQNDTDNEIAFL